MESGYGVVLGGGVGGWGVRGVGWGGEGEKGWGVEGEGRGGEGK